MPTLHQVRGDCRVKIRRLLQHQGRGQSLFHQHLRRRFRKSFRQELDCTRRYRYHQASSDLFTVYHHELTEYRSSLERATEEEAILQSSMTEMAAIANQQFSSLENATHIEMTSMAQQLQILNSGLMAARQEDEGATYRIEELERYQTMSNEMATHLEMRYRQRKSEFDEQMNQANAIMVQARS